jgi:aspartyl-tRNA(Asn)/glutamyl-tRNA(Gln) amidotransferase subunit A
MKGLRIGILRELDRTTMETCVRETLRGTVQRAMDLGAEIVECSAPSLTLASEAYCVIASAEASSNLARFDGVRYGRRADAYADMEELLCRSRSEGFGKEVKRRLLLGTYLLSGGCQEGYYGRALSLRRVLTEEIGRALGGCDALLLPVAPTPAFPLGQKTEDTALRFSEDLFCAVASLCGLPALSLPMGRNEAGLPIGLQLMGRVDSEGLLYRMGASLEDAFREEDRA